MNGPTPIDFPFRTYLKVLFAAFAVFVFLKIANLLLLVGLAILIATTLYPIEGWLVRKGVPRTLAFIALALATIGVFATFLFVLLPMVADQFGAIPEKIGPVIHDLGAKIPDEEMRAKFESFLKDPPKAVGDLPAKLVAISTSLMGALFSVGLMLVMALYFLADGKKTYRWLRAFASAPNQKKLDQTADEVSKIVTAYVAGQLITSALVAVFVYALLSLSKVPAALALAVLAAVFDILPMIGFLVSLAAAGLIALTVSSSTALVVLAAFVGYHFLENYVIVPWIYGNRMRLSGLVVLLSLTVAVEVGGVLAGILILPVIAAYPVVEKIWLGKWLGARTLADHAKLEASADPKPSTD
ncbi:MAG: AI-2E family transporter [Bdellovibrionales bacterium]|nr:AI-2E family transporter [Bdellovibrionales bacterium]